MKTTTALFAFSMLFSRIMNANILYVDLNSTDPLPPFATWSNAATNIQDAIDLAVDGDQVMVSNGVYHVGGRVVAPGVLTNRVVITNAITVRSVNGPALTTIQGFQVPSATNGDSAIRCVYMDNGARLFGFTVTNGATRTTSSFDAVDDQVGGVFAYPNCVVSNCVITGNAGYYVGGAVTCTIQSSSIIGNWAIGNAGGAEVCDLDNCIISSNHTYYGSGGGVRRSTLNNCLISANYLDTDFGQSGGADNCYLTNCSLIQNISLGWAGGAGDSTLYNCLIISNSAVDGGGASDGNLYNCTVIGNTASDQAGGAYQCASYNSILYFNDAPTGPNYWKSPCGTFNPCGKIISCCTTPLPGNPGDGVTNWDGTFTNAPLFVDLSSGNFHLQRGSACVNAGSNSYVTVSTDRDGNSRVVGGAVDVGAYEVKPLVHYISLTSINPTPPFATWSTAATNIQDAINVSTSGDQLVVTNGTYHGCIAVTNTITIASVNGATATIIDGNHTNCCANLADGGELIGFTLTNGYAFTGAGALCASTNTRLSSCILVSNYCFGNYGGGAFSGALSDCKLALNYCYNFGGGAAYSILNNCVVSNNFAAAGGGTANAILNNCTLVANRAYSGGGDNASSLVNCLVANNTAVYDFSVGSQPHGGGLNFSRATNCTIVGNVAQVYPNYNLPRGGGAFQSTLVNCVVYSNIFGASGKDNYANSTLDYCCTTPLPASGINNFTNAPLLANQPSADFHLQPASPCINSGKNIAVSLTNDLDANPRIVGGTVDVGCYEFQFPASQISYAWLANYGLATDGSADFVDSDGDGLNNWQEWRAGTVPTNAASTLNILTAAVATNGTTITWQSGTGINYFIQRATDLSVPSPFSTIQNNIIGQQGTTSFTDPSAPETGSVFYRVGAQ